MHTFNHRGKFILINIWQTVLRVSIPNIKCFLSLLLLHSSPSMPSSKLWRWQFPVSLMIHLLTSSLCFVCRCECPLKTLESCLGLEDPLTQPMSWAVFLMSVHFWYIRIFHSFSIDNIFNLLKFSTITLLPHLQAQKSLNLHWKSHRNQACFVFNYMEKKSDCKDHHDKSPLLNINIYRHFFSLKNQHKLLKQ